MIFIRLIVLAVFLCGMAFFGITALVDFEWMAPGTLGGDISSAGLISLVVALIASNAYHPIIKRLEVKHGYTTLPLNYQFVEMRDPRTGQVLRRGGDPLPTRFGLKAAREYARQHYGAGASQI
ncbi:hypothetical protein [Leifsonia sp. EB34]|jgi:hypothetical protein|uniref:hypothetical protein n=1 Tax=Leifsonia sp. EB34 TaxID=3156303 RepID=UPI003510FD31